MSVASISAATALLVELPEVGMSGCDLAAGRTQLPAEMLAARKSSPGPINVKSNLTAIQISLSWTNKSIDRISQMTVRSTDAAEVKQRYLLEAATIPAPVEAAAKAMHQTLLWGTTPWEYENPKLRDHYRAQACVAINAYESCRISISEIDRAAQARSRFNPLLYER